ncbi:MAG: energy-coupling factor ABC transporter ATP-binding protein [Candidatus Promineofilum sp.]|uniref:energy-coupling factor ABC transporter ATP-binding protein n=1 Tax=Promineifilum sp. TaxID=2664178 RepID=UPI002411E80A|nr:energy-coupling factor ABC transporter ATP-binding protein [Promineifilum sp.]
MPVVHPQPDTAAAEAAHSRAWDAPAAGPAPVVEIAALSYAYPDGRAALADVSLTIRPGEKVALVGPNGAGKSTLMLHLNGILGKDAPVRIGGLPLTREHLPLIRARVGLVFQNPDDQLFSPTVFEDVAFGPLHLGLPEDEVRRRSAVALEQVGLAGFEDRLSHHLSIGQKKRVALATVLSMEPDILVLDEPTAGLDPRGRRRLIELLRELPRTLLVSTHDMALVAELFPRAIIMDEGRVVADGATAELLGDSRLLEAHGLESPYLAPDYEKIGPSAGRL